ncbi:MAG TPA: VRR-NUC domain-containing protein, partial [Dissulfurispiraceae bacterium]|nr:VRR-NUC domain-containing protein [Dissulfurispiraceae bacterium]
MGLRSGIADLVVMSADGRAHFLEVKTATGVLSPSQIRFAELCLKKGWHYAVARSVEEAMKIC